MIRYARGNLLDADAEAVVNTVNTVGVMGKGIALMFKERYPDNYRAYAAACKRGGVEVGRMFVTESAELSGPRWVVNFPTKRHWRNASKLQWVEAGLLDLRRVIADRAIRSIAVPPLGSGNGGLDWQAVRPLIEREIGDLPGVEVIVYEPTRAYQNVSKKTGVERLTPARALVAEMVRRYGALGLDCSILEVQKLAWVLSRVLGRLRLADPLALDFRPQRYGPYADGLRHLLDKLDGSYLHADKRLADASPLDVIHFDPDHATKLASYLRSTAGSTYAETVERADVFIDGFQSPLGMEVLATVDWVIEREGAASSVPGVRAAIDRWPAGDDAARRKQRLFTDDLIAAAVERSDSLRA